jgi:hypothetical protein
MCLRFFLVGGDGNGEVIVGCKARQLLGLVNSWLTNSLIAVTGLHKDWCGSGKLVSPAKSLLQERQGGVALPGAGVPDAGCPEAHNLRDCVLI